MCLIRDVINAMPGNNRHVSFDAPVSSEEDSFTLLDMIETDGEMQPDLKLMEESLRLDIQYSLNSLAPREAEVLAYYFGLKGEKPLTLDEIGEQLGANKGESPPDQGKSYPQVEEDYAEEYDDEERICKVH